MLQCRQRESQLCERQNNAKLREIVPKHVSLCGAKFMQDTTKQLTRANSQVDYN